MLTCNSGLDDERKKQTCPFGSDGLFAFTMTVQGMFKHTAWCLYWLDLVNLRYGETISPGAKKKTFADNKPRQGKK